MGRHKIESEYRLPKEIYMMTVWTVRSYRQLIAEYDMVLEESPAPADGMPHGSSSGDDGIISKVVRLNRITEKTKAIERALDYIPEEYRRAIFRNIIDREPYPDTANRLTWAKYRQRYIYHTAVLLGYASEKK